MKDVEEIAGFLTFLLAGNLAIAFYFVFYMRMTSLKHNPFINTQNKLPFLSTFTL